MGLNTVYKAKSFDLSGLTGISDETLAMHFKLYEGYVTNTNTLNEKIADLIKGGELDATKTAAYSEMKRRFGFEYNGMVLHEYYFGNMKKQGTGDPNKDTAFAKAAAESFGSYEVWKADFVATGKMRAVGWGGYTARSTDSGLTWSTVTPAVGHSSVHRASHHRCPNDVSPVDAETRAAVVFTSNTLSIASTPSAASR